MVWCACTGDLYKDTPPHRGQLQLFAPCVHSLPAAAAAACFVVLLVQHLKAIGEAAMPYGPQVVFYLAAAVSDFYVPWSQLVSPLQLQR